MHRSGSDEPIITYADKKGQALDEAFDLVVLSVGLRPSRQAVELAKDLGIEVGEDKFLTTEPFNPVSTKLPGIFVCGGLSGLHDIGQSIIQAAESVSEISSVLEPQLFKPLKTLPEVSRDTESEPKILVVYDLCQGMDQDIGVEIEKNAKEMPSVAYVSKVNGDIAGMISGALKKTGASRVGIWKSMNTPWSASAILNT